MARPPLDIAKLSAEERLALIEELWDSLDPEERDSISLTPEQQRELDRRLDALQGERAIGISSEELFARIQRRSR